MVAFRDFSEESMKLDKSLQTDVPVVPLILAKRAVELPTKGDLIGQSELTMPIIPKPELGTRRPVNRSGHQSDHHLDASCVGYR